MASLIVGKKSRNDEAVLAKLPTQLVWAIFSFLPHEKETKNGKKIQLKLLNLNAYERERLRRQCCAFREVLLLELYTTFPHPNHKSLYSLLVRLHQLAESAPEKTPDCIFIDEGVHRFLAEDDSIPTADHDAQLPMLRDMGSINYSVCLTGRGRGRTIINCCYENIRVCGSGLHVEIRDLTLMEGCFNIHQNMPPSLGLLKEEEKERNALEVKAKTASEEGLSFVLENIGVYCMSRFGLKASNAQGTCRNIHMYGEVSEGMWITNGSVVTLCESVTSTRDPPYNDDYVFHVDSGSTLRVLLPLTIFDCYHNPYSPSEEKMFFGGGGGLEHVDSSMRVFSSFSRSCWTEGTLPIKQLREELNTVLNAIGLERHLIETALLKKREDASNEFSALPEEWSY